MQKSVALIALAAFLCLSCSGGSGSQGPPGPQGPPGEAGLLGQVFDVEVTFTFANDYQVLVEFPADIQAFDSDIVHAYLLVEVDNGVDIWAPLPQTLFFGADILLYGFDYTFADIALFLDGTVDPATLDPLYTDNVVFRVAVIPADLVDFASTGDLEAEITSLPRESVQQIR